ESVQDISLSRQPIEPFVPKGLSSGLSLWHLAKSQDLESAPKSTRTEPVGSVFKTKAPIDPLETLSLLMLAPGVFFVWV
ncbi:MAG: hypothetical protein KC587_09705, partial [Nitrospira sp.]|nr:hypothetical protein [Nitrospira sp.]